MYIYIYISIYHFSFFLYVSYLCFYMIVIFNKNIVDEDMSEMTQEELQVIRERDRMRLLRGRQAVKNSNPTHAIRRVLARHQVMIMRALSLSLSLSACVCVCVQASVSDFSSICVCLFIYICMVSFISL